MVLTTNTILIADEIVELLKTISAGFGAVAVIGGGIYAICKWIMQRKKNTDDIAALRNTHNEDIQALKDELCVLSYAMLACLDGLKQLHCNGEVTKAHDALEKHLNQRAHDKK